MLHFLAWQAATQPLSQPVEADDLAFIRRKGVGRAALRTIKRQLVFALSGQRRWLRPRLQGRSKRVLWIHEEMPQLGDALMDLAPRSLLVEQGWQVDLVADPHIVALFAGDPWIHRCFGVAEAAGDYDIAICSSHARRALRIKRLHWPQLPWVSLAGYYGGPDYHRARFTTRRLADLLGLTLDEAAYAHHSAQKLAPVMLERDWAAQQLDEHGLRTGQAIALAVGGVSGNRTFQYWPAVATALHGRGASGFVLVGSANGGDAAAQIESALPGSARVLNLAGRCNLQQTRAALAASAVVLCADGGLMHLALASAVPVVGLFTDNILPQWRLPLGFAGRALQSATANVDGIAVDAVVDSTWSLLLGQTQS